jgi:3-hydroxyanthranilate 3,4-dioxygenase
MLKTFKEAEHAGFYDEFPVLAIGIDPQLHLSRNDRQQPFFQLCEKDTVLLQMTGHSHLELKDSPVLWDDLKPGDHVYIPAGTPHRITPNESSIMYRYKAEEAGLEGVAWYCEACGAEVHREVWDTAEELPQEGYLRSCTEFNSNEEQRSCQCGAIHPAVDISGNQWADIAKTLRAESGQAAQSA